MQTPTDMTGDERPGDLPMPAAREASDAPRERYAYACAMSLPGEPGARWTAEAPDLDACRSEGDGAAECIANIADAVEAWVSAARQRGDALPPPTPLDVLARRPAFAKALWLLIVRREKPDDLAVSKALAEAGALPSLGALTADPAPPAQPLPAADPAPGAAT